MQMRRGEGGGRGGELGFFLSIPTWAYHNHYSLFSSFFGFLVFFKCWTSLFRVGWSLEIRKERAPDHFSKKPCSWWSVSFASSASSFSLDSGYFGWRKQEKAITVFIFRKKKRGVIYTLTLTHQWFTHYHQDFYNFIMKYREKRATPDPEF